MYIYIDMIVSVLCLTLAVAAQEIPAEPEDVTNHIEDDTLNNTVLLLAFVVVRHGDRTPDYDELELSPSTVRSEKVFFPYGMKALTNEGKRRSFRTGQYLRRRYDGLVSNLYLTDELLVRTTNFDRTKMTALTVLAGLYPPAPPQQWNPALLWQPIPYSTLPVDRDDLHYWYNCPRYLWLRNQVYKMPDIQKRLKNYQDLFRTISEHTHTNITTPEDVFYLDNLFQALENVGIEEPDWAKKLTLQIKEMTKIEYGIQFYTDELIQLATGVLMSEFVKATSSAVRDEPIEPKLRIYSAHENNVAALMAAARVFRPHQPGYGSAFSLELRRNRDTGRFGIAAVYAPDPRRPEKVLKVSGCGYKEFCDYDTFLRLTKDILMTKKEFYAQCPKTE